MMDPTGGNWGIGNHEGSIVTDIRPEYDPVGDLHITFWGGYHIANVIHDRDVPLIAASKELLMAAEALVALEREQHDHDDPGWCGICAVGADQGHQDNCPVPLAEAAIAKARGQEARDGD